MSFLDDIKGMITGLFGPSMASAAPPLSADPFVQQRPPLTLEELQRLQAGMPRGGVDPQTAMASRRPIQETDLGTGQPALPSVQRSSGGVLLPGTLPGSPGILLPGAAEGATSSGTVLPGGATGGYGGASTAPADHFSDMGSFLKFALPYALMAGGAFLAPHQNRRALLARIPMAIGGQMIQSRLEEAANIQKQQEALGTSTYEKGGEISRVPQNAKEGWEKARLGGQDVWVKRPLQGGALLGPPTPSTPGMSQADQHRQRAQRYLEGAAKATNTADMLKLNELAQQEYNLADREVWLENRGGGGTGRAQITGWGESGPRYSTPSNRAAILQDLVDRKEITQDQFEKAMLGGEGE